MKTSLLILIVAAGAAAGVGSQFYLANDARSSTVDPGGKPIGEATTNQIAANGVVEGARPEAALRFEVPGIIATVSVREGQEVQRGSVLAELANETQKHHVALAKAELAIAKADLERLQNGERKETRNAAAAVEQARKILLQQAEADYKRSQRLSGTDAASREQNEHDRFKLQQAKAELAEAAAKHALADAPSRPEDIAAAEGHVASAEAKLRLAETDLAKTRLTARSAGRILQVHAEPGELANLTSVQPILSMSDLSHLRVRAFIEELDAGRVQPGQRAVATADGYPGKEYRGKVALVIPRMGKRAPQTDQPNEYKDMYFREVLIDLDSSAADLPVNLRVQVRIDAAANAEKP